MILAALRALIALEFLLPRGDGTHHKTTYISIIAICEEVARVTLDNLTETVKPASPDTLMPGLRRPEQHVVLILLFVNNFQKQFCTAAKTHSSVLVAGEGCAPCTHLKY
jgi:hypothetical protein